MATYTPVTTSNNASITNREAIEELLEVWGFIPTHGDLTASLTEDTIAFHGATDFEPYRNDAVSGPDDRHENVDAQGFLEALLPYLDEQLTIQTIGNEKHRYPLCQQLKIADPDLGQVVTSNSLEWREHLEQKARSVVSCMDTDDIDTEDIETVTISVESLEQLAAEAEGVLDGINDPEFHESRSAEGVRSALADAGQALNQDDPVEEHQTDADYWQSR